jgi:hypothetical protein
MTYSYNSLTYGAEMEGAFSIALFGAIDQKRLGIFKHDGSVNVPHDQLTFPRSERVQFSEVASKILNYKGIIDFLSLFTDDNYTYNMSTGLHLHIGLKKVGGRILQGALCDFKLISKLQKIALTEMCDCQKERLRDENNYYFNLAKTKNSLINNYRTQTKYKFLRFHPSGTLEFRFLKPCVHKIENVKKLIDEIIKYLNETQVIKKRGVKEEVKPYVLEYERNYGMIRLKREIEEYRTGKSFNYLMKI